MNNELLSDRINNLTESATLKMTQKSRELKTKGFNVITLSVGEPDFNTPESIKEAAKDAIDKNMTRYTPVPGYLALREAVVKKFRKDNDLDYTPEQIVISNGAKQSIANAMLCLINPGDEVIIPSPYWVSYPAIAQLAEGTVVEIKASSDNDFKFTAAQLENVITEKSKVLIFSSPCNPTGSVFSKEDLKAIADVVAKHKNLFVIADEIYEHINFKEKHESIAQFNNVKDQVITVNGVSKGFAMTGWRIGYLGAPLFIAKACNKLQGQYTSGASSIAQAAATEAALTDASASEELQAMVKAFKERRDLVIGLLKEIPGIKTNVPDGAFYVFPEVSSYFGKSFNNYTINNSNDLCLYILETVYVALVPGEAFGSEECVRISYAVSNEQIIEAISRMKSALAKLN
ncbi:MAG: pyridoxal phosphate-dependent aminotransferase [Bacteroidetes bacterium]|nr:pyridoxal phosphate-dependent aminotransferase [Bacteroidota bacterium]